MSSDLSSRLRMQVTLAIFSGCGCDETMAAADNDDVVIDADSWRVLAR